MAGADEFRHFVDAQAPLYEGVCRELEAGAKRTHWMWFIFPQLHGLGHSPMAERYALYSVAQARRYLAHELLGPRLRECTRLVLNVQNQTAFSIFGEIDSVKFRSSMTLFSMCAASESIFTEAIERYYAGESDHRTLRMLGIPEGTDWVRRGQ
jgi:uncharacterized protein (DUF1810 family)